MNDSHTHHYSFWHAHAHKHLDDRALVDVEFQTNGPYIRHDTGHYHNWMQIHEHGAGGNNPHTHKARQYHEENDPETKHHHALGTHDIEEE